MSDTAVAVWSHWDLHADALASVLRQDGLAARVVSPPGQHVGLLVAEAVRVDDLGLLEERARAGRRTVVWGGTLPAPRIAALREAGAAAYVTALRPPSELAAVVRMVQQGHRPQWVISEVGTRSLTRREREVARAYLMVWADRPRADVAARLGMSERTLKVHVANIRAKAGHRGTGTRDGLLRTLTVRGWLT